MTVTTENINLGAAQVTFKGNDLGATKGGVEVDIKTEKYTVKSDQTGETPLKEFITGTTITVKVPLLETDLVRLKDMMAQSVSTTGNPALPTGWAVNNATGYAVGAVTVAIGSGTNDPVVGDTFTFSGHATVYRVTDYSAPNMTFVEAASGAGGLVAPVADAETLTFEAGAAGVEIRTGVNTDLFANAGLLFLHPDGVPTSVTGQDFTVFKAGPEANFTFKYELAGERVYEVMFTAYPDTANNNRLAAFGKTA